MLTSRAVRRADAAVVAGLWTAANTQRQAEVGLQLGPVDGADIAEAERQVRRRLTDPASFALLVEEDSDPVALALVLQALAQDGASQDPTGDPGWRSGHCRRRLTATAPASAHPDMRHHLLSD